MNIIEDRLENGKRKYDGEIDVEDGRDWEIEALEEILDGMVYIAAKILQIKRRN